ncbi:MAG: copper homeostasis protein CutC [Faecalicatena sp.]|uniref:copper homeostasis protein CutC n=1 Tax=Faecalicatena sp. TaxID=2005360 RepID=UPI0025838B3C|nr:copper homeostasis protein CutC [Faecalicatena sp.]MCI6467600.1 copper homeostasis protein CutC [Faecalicatena sp.]MDY5619776.1 copper homeostasis protein CutC [Lachnospiraceae bacterium]
MKDYMLEVCVDSVESAIAAERGGAKRLELCSNLIIGGTTPTPALFCAVRKAVDIKIHVLIRPRFGDFCYTDAEFEIIRKEVRQFRELGADGAVIGVLRPDGTLNMEQMEGLVREAGEMKLTLHRAFDVCSDPMRVLEECVELGIHTILTSGQEESALAGAGLLRRLNEAAAGRIHILVGAGVNSGNLEELCRVTGLNQFHMSGKKVLDSSMKYRREGVPMGLPGISEFSIWRTEEEEIRKAVEVLERSPNVF